MRSVAYVTTVYNHHAQHSGYHLLAKAVSSNAVVISASSVRKAGSTRIKSFMRRHFGRHYDLMALRNELAGLWTLTRGKVEVLHYLYGDRDMGIRHLWPLKPERLVCATFHKPPTAFKRRFEERVNLRGLPLAICVGRNQIQTLYEYGVQHAEFVPHGVDTSFWTTPETHIDQYWNPLQAVAVGFHMRDFETLYACTEKLALRFKGFRLKLIAPRERIPDPPSESVEVLFGISDEELRETYRNSCFHLLSMTDCTANCALLESMSCGTPTVATDCGAVRDYASPDGTFFCPPGDADAMAEQCGKLIEDHLLNHRMRLLARKNALRFDWSEVAKEISLLYDCYFKS